MGKILVCGDIHCKKAVVDKALKLYEKNNCDKLIFIGDYTDDWNDTVEQNLEILDYLFHLKHIMGDRLVLLIGNHDISNWIGGEFKCSGFSEVKYAQLKFSYEANKYDFKMAHAENGFLITHAGVCIPWLKFFLKVTENKELDDEYLTKPKKVADLLNNYQFELSLFYPEDSPLWARLQHYLEESDFPCFKQVVGHSPVRKILWHKQGHMFFIDTHSTYSDGEKIGDGTFLIINPNGSVKIV